MRNLNRGQILTKQEIKELAENFIYSKHAMQRMMERNGWNNGVDKVKEEIENPLIAYFNTDYSINVAPTENRCYVFVRKNEKYIMVTYKDDTHMKMSDKRLLAVRGIGKG